MTPTENPNRGHSLEFFPPKTDKGRARLLDAVQSLKLLKPAFVSVTFGAGGSTRDRSYEIATDILKATELQVTPHLSCIGSTREDLSKILGLYKSVGVKRIMALRGDKPTEDVNTGPQDFHYANELVAFIKENFPSFKISVACYPEFHPEAASASADVDHFVRKAKSGADEAISQYFFGNESFYRFRETCVAKGVQIPLVPGLMPITDFKQIERFSKFCGADIPLWIRKRMTELADDPKGQKELGIEIATRQAEDLLKNGVPGLHFYTLNQAGPSERIWRNLNLTNPDEAASTQSASNSPN